MKGKIFLAMTVFLVGCQAVEATIDPGNVKKIAVAEMTEEAYVPKTGLEMWEAYWSSIPEREEGQRYVFLTFDDGPTPNTIRIAEILEAHQIHGSFFMEGNILKSYPNRQELVERLLNKGHFLGLHSMSHDPHILYWNPGSYQAFMEEMRTQQQLIYDLSGGFLTHLIRPPFGSIGNFTEDHRNAVDNSDFKVWDWNIDTNDWRYPSVERIMEEVQSSLDIVNANRPEQDLVVLFHKHDVVLEALPIVIAFFREKGYEFLPYHPELYFELRIGR